MESVINACTKDIGSDGQSKNQSAQEAEKKGIKWDDEKKDWHALPLVILNPLVDVFVAGIKKGYGRFNCLNSFDDADRRFFSAAMRHLEACQLDPLAIDEETGCYHAAQVAFNALLRLHNALRTME